MKWKRVTVGVFVTSAAILFMPRPTHRENLDAPLMADIRTIHIAESEFYSRYGRYASLSELSQRGRDVLGEELAEGRSQTHRLFLTATGSRYTIQTAPINRGPAPYRSFYSDQTLVIRQSNGPGVASDSSPILGSGR